MEMVSISDFSMALLRDYSGKTGIPIERCLNDALFDWLGNVAPVVLAQCGLPALDPGKCRHSDTTSHTLRR
jgi:hypothetical protein